MTNITDRCRCGAMRWEMTGPLLLPSHCHCDDCRRATSSQLTSKIWPEEAHLFAASRDDPSRFAPTGHAFWGERGTWCDVHDKLPKYPTLSDVFKAALDAT